jgi:hypothetical protein
MRKFVLCAIIIIAAQSHAFAFNANQEAANGLAGVYGYTAAQEKTLNQIVVSYPELKEKVQLAKLDFKATYGDVMESVKSILTALFPDLKESFFEQLKTSDSQDLTKPVAENFIKTVHNRAQGIIERESIKKFLLAATFYTRPEREFVKFGENFDFSSDPKSKGLNLKLITPQSWLASDSRFPNTLKTWKTEAGTGKGFANLEVHRWDGPKTDSEYVKNAVSKGEIPRNLLPKNAILGSLQFTEISGLPAVTYSFNVTTDRVGLKVRVRQTHLES